MTAQIPMWSRASDIRTIALGNGCQGQWLLSHLYEGELPDAVWYILGTSIHTAIEDTILNDLSLEDMLAAAHIDKQIMLHEAEANGIIQQTSKRAKRGIDTIDLDIERMCGKWWKDVHPSSPDRMKPYNDYAWPPQVEYQIDVGKDDLRLITTVDALFEQGEKYGENKLIIDWKGLTLDTPLPTPTGWTTMGDVQTGDWLFDMHGIPTQVTNKSRLHNKPTYRITFDDSSTLDADTDHKWVLETGEIKTTAGLTKRDYISTTQPLMGYAEHPVDPYVLGVWLGDGTAKSGAITSMDEEIFTHVQQRGGYEMGHRTETAGNKGVTQYFLGLTEDLRGLGVLKNKHIPQTYLRGSQQDREDLLRGLMDSDGTYNQLRKQAVIEMVDEKLIDQIFELVASLGWRPYKWSGDAKGFGLTVQRYRVSWAPDRSPFLLGRKARLVGKGSHLSRRRRVKRLEILPRAQWVTQCITVDSPSETYLAGKAMIPTHNTGSTKKSHPSQLQIYAYGFSKLKMFDTDEQLVLGGFHHIDHSTIQYEYDYWGDEIIEDMIRATSWIKSTEGYVFNPDWWCNYCVAKDKCPIMGDGDLKEIKDKLGEAVRITEPLEEE